MMRDLRVTVIIADMPHSVDGFWCAGYVEEGKTGSEIFSQQASSLARTWEITGNRLV